MTGSLVLVVTLWAATPSAAEPKPFMAVELRMAPFKGEDAAQTRRRAEAFLARTGLKVIDYQDNEALMAADIRLPPAPEGALAAVRWGFEKMQLLRSLRARPNVAQAEERGDGRVELMFKPFIYRDEAERLRASLPAGSTLAYYLNPAMKGLWVSLDVSGLTDARAAARELTARFPNEIASAGIRVKVEVYRAKIGSR